jgi:hypothetical protein
MGQRMQYFIKTDKGMLGYHNQWSYGGIPVVRLIQLAEHQQLLMNDELYSSLVKGREEEMIRFHLAANFQERSEATIHVLGQSEIQHPHYDWLDNNDGILVIDLRNNGFRYCLIDLKNYRIMNAIDYMLEYEIEYDEVLSYADYLIEHSESLLTLKEEDLEDVYPELAWEIKNYKQSLQMEKITDKIEKWVDENRIEFAVAYNYLTNHFYYRSGIPLSYFDERSPEGKAFKSIGLDLTDALSKTTFIFIDKEGKVRIETTDNTLLFYMPTIVGLIKENYSILERELLITAA